VRKTIVNVLIDDIRFVKDQIAFHPDRRPIVRIHHRQVFRLVKEIDIYDLKIHSFFKQDNPASLAEWASGARVKSHHWLLPGVNQCTSFQYSFLSNQAGTKSYCTMADAVVRFEQKVETALVPLATCNTPATFSPLAN